MLDKTNKQKDVSISTDVQNTTKKCQKYMPNTTHYDTSTCSWVLDNEIKNEIAKMPEKETSKKVSKVSKSIQDLDKKATNVDKQTISK